jgi:hypothetical protein
MKTIQIKKMVLTNFKGLRNQEVIFDKKYEHLRRQWNR